MNLKTTSSQLRVDPCKWPSCSPKEIHKEYVEVNGHRFYVVTSGDPKRGVPVLCIPRAMGTARTDFPHQLASEGPLARAAGDGFFVVSFDPRGCGSSRPPKREFPEDFQLQDAKDAGAIMEASDDSALYPKS